MTRDFDGGPKINVGLTSEPYFKFCKPPEVRDKVVFNAVHGTRQ